MPVKLLFPLLLAIAAPAFAQDKPANTPATKPAAAAASTAADSKPEMTLPLFEMFRLVPGQAEAFIREMAEWDQVSIAGGQPPTQLFLHESGEGWDVLLYKVARPKPTPEQNAVMATKAKAMGLTTGPEYFLELRKKMADHVHFEAIGPTTAAQWLAELDKQRAEAKAKK